MGIELSSEQRKLFEILLFLIKLILFSIPLYLILAFPGILIPLQEVVSENVYLILKSMGSGVSRNGFLLTMDGIAFMVSEDCTGWKSMLFLTALIFAVPGVEIKKRLAGIVVGVPLIYIGNLVRILAVVSIWETYGYETASLVHDYFWQAGLISLVLVIWVLWLHFAGKMEITFLKRLHKLIKPR
jgi:exosortase/archaeosortase family protein